MITNIHHRKKLETGKSSERLNNFKFKFVYNPYMQPTWRDLQIKNLHKLCYLADSNEVTIGHTTKVKSLFYN